MNFKTISVAIFLMPALIGCGSVKTMPPSTASSSSSVPAPGPGSPQKSGGIKTQIEELLARSSQELDSGMTDQAEADALAALKLSENSYEPGSIDNPSVALIHNQIGIVYMKKCMALSQQGAVGKAKRFQAKAVQEFKTALQIDRSCNQASDNLASFSGLDIK